MLLRNNTAPVDDVRDALGRLPRPVGEFIPPAVAPLLRGSALASWLRPLLRVALAVMWVTAGVVSWIAARDEGLALLGALAMPPPMALWALAIACVVNVAFGVATLVRPGRLLWLAQLGVMAFYTAALSWAAPQLWLDPFGSLVKNLPIAVVLIGLYVTEE